MKLSAFLLALAIPALCLGSPWQLDPEKSQVRFVSVKNNAIAEVHRFDKLSGIVSPDGTVSVSIPLTGVETNIPIRNERMIAMLFETERFASAVIEASVDVKAMQQLMVGQTDDLDLMITLSLHGESGELPAEVRVTRTADNVWLVASVSPVIVSAESFGLGKGIEALRQIAGLSSIAVAVPVSFSLVFAGE